jgi:ribosome-associated protein
MRKKTIKDDADFVLSQIVKGMQDKKAKKIISLDLTEIPNTVTRYFVICHAQSKQQVGAIYDNVEEEVLKNCGIKPFHREGFENSEWILLDYFDIVVHIFLEDIRTFYHIEDLWADAVLKEYESDD